MEFISLPENRLPVLKLFIELFKLLAIPEWCRCPAGPVSSLQVPHRCLGCSGVSIMTKKPYAWTTESISSSVILLLSGHLYLQGLICVHKAHKAARYSKWVDTNITKGHLDGCSKYILYVSKMKIINPTSYIKVRKIEYLSITASYYNFKKLW